MKKSFGLAVLIIALMFGCASSGGSKPDNEKATKSGSGKGSTILVMIDRGIEKSFDGGQVSSRNQIGEWMELDLPAVLHKKGFNARIISKRSEYSHAPGVYLLTVKITDYNPGNKAARMMVGYGAGAASMKTHFELYSQGSSPILSDDTGVGSGRDWRNVVRKSNELMTKSISEKLGE